MYVIVLKIPVKENAINIIFWQTYHLWRILSGFYAFHAVTTRSRVSPQPVSLFLPHILVFYLLAYTYHIPAMHIPAMLFKDYSRVEYVETIHYWHAGKAISCHLLSSKLQNFWPRVQKFCTLGKTLYSFNSHANE